MGATDGQQGHHHRIVRVLLAGASGFIGSEIKQKLLASHHGVVEVNRDSNLGGEIKADVCVNAARTNADSGSALVQANLRLVDTLLNLAVRSGCKRFVQLSSISVYGEPPPSGLITEDSPRLASLGAYAAMKQATERLVLSAAEELDVVVLQPAIVYGGGYWTRGILEVMERSLWPLVDHGDGYCNPIHVSDVARAVIRSLDEPAATGQCMILANPMPVTWRSFLGHYQNLLERRCLLDVPTSLIEEPSLMPGMLRRLIHKAIRLRHGRSLAALTPEQVAFYRARPIFTGARAEQSLGFRPLLTLEQGMARLQV